MITTDMTVSFSDLIMLKIAMERLASDKEEKQKTLNKINNTIDCLYKIERLAMSPYKTKKG